ncbi:OmpA family protein [Thalassotalea sp. ND16A]|uniref:OmpA family protein n=1 Tax=Thalassotalea sp. ND16A TaxID=1535422 RepID=UPI00051A87ED|nr:OmpA family protein [Thalassotalea sp. ND16A]KGJ97149.1 hypothetical protein ND16A_0071 [Thalassotalea sp. ND16A]
MKLLQILLTTMKKFAGVNAGETLLCATKSVTLIGILTQIFNGTVNGITNTMYNNLKQNIGKSMHASVLLPMFSLMLILGALPANAADRLAQNGEQVTNQAILSFNGGELTAETTVKVVFTESPNKTPSIIEFYQFNSVDNNNSTAFDLELLQYSSNGGELGPYIDDNSPVPAGSRAIDHDDLVFPTTLNLNETSSYAPADPIFIKVTDLDQNRNDAVKETIIITISTDLGSDAEVLILTETGVNTGVFIGYIASIYSSSEDIDGRLSVLPNSRIEASYTDRFDQSDVSATAALIDPFGFIFNSATGEGINDIAITLINADTEQPAEVFSPDGVTAYPSSIVSGQEVIDSAGNIYQLGQGAYYFPLVAAGNYRLQIETPDGYLAGPTSKTDEELAQLSNGDELTLVLGSRFETFAVVPGPALEIDVPIDPIATDPFISKRSNKSSAALGDFVQFTVEVSNPSILSPSDADIIIDTLPIGFRYVKDSLTINEQVVDNPQISDDGRTMQIAINAVDVEDSLTVKYVTQVTAATPLGQAINVAELLSQQHRDASALASLTIVEDLFSSKSILMGRVIWDDCNADLDSPIEQRPGVQGVRIYMEDGTFVNTDSNGQWHIEGVKPGSHVVQLDVDSLPDHLEVVECTQSSRRAGTAFSEFVEVQGGTLWRTNFHLRQKIAAVGQMRIEQSISTRQTWKVELQVNFDHDKSTVKAQYYPEVQKLAEYLIANPDSNVTITGHTSTLGSSKYNFRLSHRRATAIAKVLAAEFAIAPTRIATKGYGETRPINLAEDEQAHADNRRIIAIISHNPDSQYAPKKLQVELAVNLDLDTNSRRNLHNVMASYQPPVGWKLMPGTGRVNGKQIPPQQRSADNSQSNSQSNSQKSSQQTRHNDTIIWPLTNEKQQTVAFTLTPTAELEQSIDYSGVARAQVSYQLLNSDDGNTVHTTGSSDISITKLLLAKSNQVQFGEPNASNTYRGEMLSKSSSTSATGTAYGYQVSRQQVLESAKVKVDLTPGIQSLSDGQYVSRTHTAIRFQLDSRLTPVLSIDNKPVAEDRQAFKAVDSENGITSYNYIGVEIGEQGEHTVKLQGMGPFGNARFTEEITVIRTGEVQKVRLLASDGNFADGKTPVKIQLGLLDNQGNHIPAEVKLTLENSELSPYESEYDRAVLEKKTDQITMSPDGTVLFNPVAKAGMYNAEIIYDDKVSEKIKFYVKPHLRDWILVGFAEGTLGYNHLTGNQQALTANDFENDLYQDGQVKFYAKGKVKGDWLLTMAYDTTKREDEEILNQTITPGAYYTLYGDASTQEHDAASRKKLYLRIEKDQYYALFGDFNTGLSAAELTSYNRNLTGVKAEYNGEHYNVTMFAAETEQAFVRDEIQGEGVSGLYYLSNNDVLVNSETITIETRDRFQSQEIIEERQLSRFVDYNIDYVAGTLFFKQPIFSRDRENNPIYIVAEYETESDTGKDDLVAGGRVGIILPGFNGEAEAGEVGITHISEGDSGRSGTLTGVDVKYNLSEQVRISAEVASSDTDFEGEEHSGEAYIVEVEHQGEQLDGKVYVREQRANFGLGQQSESEEAMRKVGTQGRYNFTDEWELEVELFQQKDLATTRKRDVAETRIEYDEKDSNYYAGLRTAKDSGGASSQQEQKSDQIILGTRQNFFDNDLTLTTDFENTFSDDENQDYPTRIRVGADYDITDAITLNADQEFAQGDEGNEQMTLLGVTARPWTGMNIGSSLQQDQSENGDRVFANYGLFQTIELSPSWDVNFGLDRAQLLSDDSKAANTPANTQESPDDETDFNQDNINSEDFTAVSLGANYNQDAWGWDSLLEYRTSDMDDKWNLLSSTVHDLAEGIVLAGKVELMTLDSNIDDNNSLTSSISLAFAYRPIVSRWIVLDRLEIKYDEDETEFNRLKSRRLINNTNVNYLLDNDTQIALQYSFKYVLETIDEEEYDGFTDLIGTEIRHNLSPQWDFGVHANMLHSWDADIVDYSYGASIGYSPEKNVWVSVGFNIDGFEDDDFSGSEYTAKGAFLRFRIKADQETFKTLFGD